MKKCLAIFLITVTVICSGCSKAPKFDTPYINNPINAAWNPNLIKLGNVEIYSKYDQNDKNYKIVLRQDNSTQVIASSDSRPLCFNVADENTLVYAVDNKLCSYNADTKQVNIITQNGNERLTNLLVADGVAYYTSGICLYMTNVHTGETTKIVDNIIGNFDVFNNAIYYQSAQTGENGELVGYIMKTDLSDLSVTETVYESAASYIEVREDGIYFLNNYSLLDGDNKLYRIDNKGVCTELCDNMVSTYNISGEWIYYSNMSDGGKLYRMQTDGSENEKILDNEVLLILVFGDELYYHTRENINDTSYMYKLDLTDFNSSVVRFE